MAESLTDDELTSQLEATSDVAKLSDDQLMAALGKSKSAPGFFDRVTELFTGGERQTDQTEELPEIVGSGLLSGQDQAKVAAVTPAIMTASNENEIAQIVTSNFPDIGLTFNQDGQGNSIPVLVNNKTGAATIINRPGFSSMDLLQATGLGAALFPATRGASAVLSGVGAGLTSAGIQGVQELSGGEFNESDVALDAALGGAGKVLENVVSSATGLAKGSSINSLVDSAGEIPVLTSDVFPPSSFAGRTLSETAEKIPLLGTSGQRAVQQEARESAVNDVIKRYGDFSYSEVVTSLKGKSDRIKRAAGNVLGSVEQKIAGVSTEKTQKAIDSAFDALSDPAVIQSDKALGDLQQLLSALNSPQTFSSLKENRTAFREILNAVDPIARSQLPSRAKAQLNQVASAMKQDLEVAAKQNLTPREFGQWQKANRVYANEAEQLTRSRLKNVLDAGQVTPEAVEGMLFSRKQSELNLLFNGLAQNGRNNARAAIISKVADNLSRRAGGVTPNAFATELKKYGPQVSTFFRGDERKALEGLGKVLGQTRRAQDAVVTTPTGQSLLALAGIGGAVADLGATATVAGSLGLLARVYNSPVVRNSLIRLSSIPRGSRRFDAALLEAQTALTLAGQSAARQNPE